MILGLLLKLWDLYEVSRSAVLLEGEKSTTFTLEQGVAQGCVVCLQYYFLYS